ncbi:hypothetical protein [Pseudomonas phage D6]|nr:hypothetical protein [Pseudomonas phage D6]
MADIESITIDFRELMNRGVTERMIRQVNAEHLGGANAGETAWVATVSQNAFKMKGVFIRTHGLNLFSLWFADDEVVDPSMIHQALAKRIVSEAHLYELTLRLRNIAVMDSYRSLRCDQRVNEAVALIEGPIGVQVYRAPKWRQDNEDCGEPRTLCAVMDEIKDHVPESLVERIQAQLEGYISFWPTIYGEKPVLSSFIHTKPAGSKLTVVIGTDKGAVDFQFNCCEAMDQNTLKPSPYVKSIIKDFK